MASERELLEVIPYPHVLRTSVWQTDAGWWCTISGRQGYDAPYWHGGPALTVGGAFEQAYQSSRDGFEGEGIKVLPTA